MNKRMMNIRIIVSISLLTFFAYSCSNENKVEKLKADVMAIHDEVMPEMDNLMKLKHQLKNKIARFDSTGASTNELNRLVERLEEADEAMMQVDAKL